MTALGYSGERFTSSELAATVNAAPSFVRRVVAKLSKAGLVQTTTGKSGSCALGRKPKEISLLEIYEAVEAPQAFSIHAYPEKKSCPVSCNIKTSMIKVLNKAQTSFETSLRSVSLEEVIADLRRE